MTYHSVLSAAAVAAILVGCSSGGSGSGSSGAAASDGGPGTASLDAPDAKPFATTRRFHDEAGRSCVVRDPLPTFAVCDPMPRVTCPQAGAPELHEPCALYSTDWGAPPADAGTSFRRELSCGGCCAVDGQGGKSGIVDRSSCARIVCEADDDCVDDAKARCEDGFCVLR